MRKKSTKRNKLTRKSTKQIQSIRLDPTDDLSNRIFPCRSNEEVRLALEAVLPRPIRVEVAGGIVRHGW